MQEGSWNSLRLDGRQVRRVREPRTRWETPPDRITQTKHRRKSASAVIFTRILRKPSPSILTAKEILDTRIRAQEGMTE